MIEIFVAYISGYSAYRIVTPFENVTKVMACNCDKVVLAALKSTKARNVNLVTKSNMYELLCEGVSPRDEVQEAIYKILIDKRVTFQRIDSDSQGELVNIMKSKLTKAENADNESVIDIFDPITMFGNKGCDKYGFGDETRYGFDSKGVHRNGTYLDDNGYGADGFDRQGYNREGNYLAYVDNYIRNNTNIVIKNKPLIYSQGVKDLFINIDRAKSSFSNNDYVGSLIHLRRGLEELVHVALTYNNISLDDIAELALFDRLNLAKFKNIFSSQELAFYHNLRKEANDNGAHMGAVENKDSTKIYLEEFIKFAHKWIENNN